LQQTCLLHVFTFLAAYKLKLLGDHMKRDELWGLGVGVELGVGVTFRRGSGVWAWEWWVERGNGVWAWE
jgi:hypothetical protein